MIDFRLKEKILVENLKIIKEIFDRHGIEFWLDWGTLLGIVRDGKIIDWDRDVDIGVNIKDFKKIQSIFTKIEGKGFHLEEPLISDPVFTFALWRRGYGLDVGVYSELNKKSLVEFHYKIISKNIVIHSLWFLCRVLACGNRVKIPDNRFKSFMSLFIIYPTLLIPSNLKKEIAKIIEKTLLRRNHLISIEVIVPRHYFDKFRHIKAYDTEFLIPLNAEEYLEYKYGENWKIPQRDWNWEINLKSIKPKYKIC